MEVSLSVHIIMHACGFMYMIKHMSVRFWTHDHRCTHVTAYVFAVLPFWNLSLAEMKNGQDSWVSLIWEGEVLGADRGTFRIIKMRSGTVPCLPAQQAILQIVLQAQPYLPELQLPLLFSVSATPNHNQIACLALAKGLYMLIRIFVSGIHSVSTLLTPLLFCTLV